MNEKAELIIALKGSKIKCADITHEHWNSEDKKILLKVGYTENDLNEFLSSLDFDYRYWEEGIEGTVWLEDGTWLEKWWDCNDYDHLQYDPPEIPVGLLQRKEDM